MVTVLDPTSGERLRMPAEKTMPCGAIASIDHEACYPAYRCETCNAIEGSVGMPARCQALTKEVLS
jgi:hypothetical protein